MIENRHIAQILAPFFGTADPVFSIDNPVVI